MATEIAKFTYSVYYYVKYKYLKNIICLLMEVMQSTFLFGFLVIAMCLHPKKFDETISDIYQDAGIWIVIASCVAEYLLLLTYIGVAAYDFFKNRKALNRALKKMKYSFIKYGRDPHVENTDNHVAPLGTIHTVQGPLAMSPSKFAIMKKSILNNQSMNPETEGLVNLVQPNKLPPRGLGKKNPGWAKKVNEAIDAKARASAMTESRRNSEIESPISTKFSHKKSKLQLGKIMNGKKSNGPSLAMQRIPKGPSSASINGEVHESFAIPLNNSPTPNNENVFSEYYLQQNQSTNKLSTTPLPNHQPTDPAHENSGLVKTAKPLRKTNPLAALLARVKPSVK
jgi:hypothetical protein